MFTTNELAAASSDTAWLQAMLDVEAALALAEADVGIVPEEAARAIADVCRADRFAVEELGRQARLGGNPVIPLTRALASRAPSDAAAWVHWGATSQDILDTAAMLVVARSLDLILPDLNVAIDACADLADRHRDHIMVGRTLLQHAVPTTFGLKAAGWLMGLLDARSGLVAVRRRRLAVELGGAAGTLASLGTSGPRVAERLAARLGLAEAVLPWHTMRGRMAELGSSLGIVSGAAGKIATDVALLMQTEVGEVREPAGPGRGGSSTLPQKRNPVGAASINGAVRQVHALVPVLLQSMVSEHERPVGAWQAEWLTLSQILQLSGGAVAWLAETVKGLDVDIDRMRQNLELTRGRVLSERVVFYLVQRGALGRDAAADLVASAAARSVISGRHLREELQDDPTVTGVLTSNVLDELFDPVGYLGAAPSFIDRALEAYRSAG